MIWDPFSLDLPNFYREFKNSLEENFTILQTEETCWPNSVMCYLPIDLEI